MAFNKRKLAFPLLIIIAIIGSQVFVDLDTAESALFSIQSFSGNQFALLTLFLIAFTIRPFTGVPPGIVCFVVGFQFGLLAGLPLVIVGTMVTGMPAYYIGRKSRSLPDWVPGVAKIMDHGERLVQEIGVFRGMLAASLAPTPLDPVAYASGVSDVPLPTYLVATAIAAIPWGGAYCYLGAVADSALAPKGPPLVIVVSGTVVATLLLAPNLLRLVRSTS